MKITIVEGTTKITSKKEILYHIFGGNAEFNAVQKNIWTASNTHIGDYEEMEIEVESNNSYIPIVSIDETKNKIYDVYTNAKKVSTLSMHIQQNLRNPKAKKIKFKSEDKIVKIKFNVKQGNSNAQDSDGGNITANFFDVDSKFIESKVYKKLKYGDGFELDWDKSLKISIVEFFADDNDWYFNGGISNVFCGVIKYGSKVGRKLTKNIENLPTAKPTEKLPKTHTYNFPLESFAVANKYKDPQGMCFAISMARVGKAFQDFKINDAISVTAKGDDYTYSGTMLKNIPDKYFGYGVGGTLSKNGYADLLTNVDIWKGKLEEGAMIQYWNNPNNKDWPRIKEAIKNSIGKNRENWDTDFGAGHSVIFKSYIYGENNKIIALWCYDYSGTQRRFEKSDTKIFLGGNLKDEK
ncbi:hypothetical protein NK356_14345 [Chryseobacterium sp. S0630]|uniref:hypothetical protein n=1 Tax=Chryseobacterium sp. S0630 TaxID=2957803 RepID=UPI0020A024BE|nr:hypothetical protein [Chryseobacterium sp. S0630]MCP1300355.1 hypothetical protein [Chryseobacterium sp. S0630]